MVVIQIAHTDIKRFDSPEHEPYDRYVIKLQTRASALLQEHSDVVLFANYQISVAKSDVGFNKKVTRALGSGARVMHTEERPAFLAKNRYGLPDTLPLRGQSSSQPCPNLNDCLERIRPWHVLTRPLTPPALNPPPPYELLPAGKYRAQIVESEMRVTKNGMGQFLWLMLDILDGQHKGRKIFDQLNLVNPNPTTVEIAQRTLSAICHATGRMHVSDSEELHLIPMTIQVKIKPPKNGYGESNAIAYLPPEAWRRQPLRKPRSPAPPHAGRFRPPKMASAPWNKKG